MPSPRRPLLLLVAWCAVWCGACGEPPEKEMAQARAAIEEARGVGADRYAADEFAAAVTALNNAEDAAAQRDYRLALNHALDSRERAEAAAAQARTRRTELRARAEAAVTAAAALLEKTQAQVKTAEGARTAARTLTPLRAAVANGERLVQEARAALQREEFEVADTAAAAATASLSKASAEFAAAANAAVRRRR
jgi:hypothetical protein